MKLSFKAILDGISSELQIEAAINFPDIFHNETDSVVCVEEITTIPDGHNINPESLTSIQLTEIENAVLAEYEKSQDK